MYMQQMFSILHGWSQDLAVIRRREARPVIVLPKAASDTDGSQIRPQLLGPSVR